MKEAVQEAKEVLNKGGVIIYPTDTIPGIGCLANDDHAVERIFEIKKRPNHKALICLFKDCEQVAAYFPDLPVIPQEIIEAERPTSIILDNVQNISPKLLGGGNSLAIRIPKNEFCQALLKEVNTPIVSTSANISNEETVHYIKDVNPDILVQIDYVVPLPTEISEPIRPSKIVRITLNGEIQTIRD